MDKITNYTQLISYLQNNSSSEYDNFNKTIINSSVKTIGCRTPFIRKLAKSFSVEDVKKLPVNDYVEVDLLKGIVLSNCKLSFAEKSDLLLGFATTIENWAVCDCSTVKVRNAEKEAYFRFFCGLISSESEFVCRYGIVNMMTNYLDDEYIDRVFQTLELIRIWGKYYVDMAVAWLVATAMAKCRNQTIKFMEGNGVRILNKFTYNKALQKMRESYRVSAEDKQWTYSMKRN